MERAMSHRPGAIVVGIAVVVPAGAGMTTADPFRQYFGGRVRYRLRSSVSRVCNDWS
jgi:hypothetical protein